MMKRNKLIIGVDWCYECDEHKETIRMNGSTFHFCHLYNKPISRKIIKQCIIEKEKFEYCEECGNILPCDDGYCPECGIKTKILNSKDVLKMVCGCGER